MMGLDEILRYTSTFVDVCILNYSNAGKFRWSPEESTSATYLMTPEGEDAI